ncbi:hypothetical protein NZK35_06475 [Stieleria sp. ICT_E10.1]|uniref:hypothetical protein n=1 Tax=Stieleria sedimenti TaxID=2976331 RepID=UPI0021804F93|nr:hypothetical protein [Stieleria sedimenti]MCS7466319.1 hypothetical protein [Stieleria sedimenti]
MTAAFMTGSSALISWGVDSIVEGNLAAFMIWRLGGEVQGISERQVLKRKKDRSVGAFRCVHDRSVVHLL